jgi:hypothetical protein
MPERDEGRAKEFLLPSSLEDPSRIPLGEKPIHDANLVATMQAHRLRRLLRPNTADFTRFGALIAVEPSVPTP